MPRNSDFEYHGLKVEHTGDMNLRDYNNRQGQFKPQPSKDTTDNGFTDVKGMVSPRKRRVTSDQPSKSLVDETREAAMKDWQNRGLSNNKIIDS